MGKTVTLLGSYGHTNLGDDLLMHNFLHLLIDQMGYQKVYMNVAEKDYLPKQTIDKYGKYLEIHATYQTSVLKWISIIRKSDTIVYGGGTIFKDLYASTGRSKHSVVFRIVIFNLLARLSGKDVYHLFIGIGSIRSKLGNLLTKFALNLAKSSYFRDDDSYDYALSTLGIKSTKIHNSTDAIFIGQDWGEPTKGHSFNAASGATVGVNVLSDIPDWVSKEDYISATVGALNEIIANGDHVVLIPFQEQYNKNSDLAFMKEHIIPALPTEGYTLCSDIQLSDLRNIFEKIDYFIGARFHSLLFSLIMRKPFVALEYDTKCSRLMDDLGYAYRVGIEKLEIAVLIERYENLKASDQSILSAKYENYCKEQADIMNDSIRSLMQNHSDNR